MLSISNVLIVTLAWEFLYRFSSSILSKVVDMPDVMLLDKNGDNNNKDDKDSSKEEETQDLSETKQNSNSNLSSSNKGDNDNDNDDNDDDDEDEEEDEIIETQKEKIIHKGSIHAVHIIHSCLGSFVGFYLMIKLFRKPTYYQFQIPRHDEQGGFDSNLKTVEELVEILQYQIGVETLNLFFFGFRLYQLGHIIMDEILGWFFRSHVWLLFSGTYQNNNKKQKQESLHHQETTYFDPSVCQFNTDINEEDNQDNNSTYDTILLNIILLLVSFIGAKLKIWYICYTFLIIGEFSTIFWIIRWFLIQTGRSYQKGKGKEIILLCDFLYIITFIQLRVVGYGLGLFYMFWVVDRDIIWNIEEENEYYYSGDDDDNDIKDVNEEIDFFLHSGEIKGFICVVLFAGFFLNLFWMKTIIYNMILHNIQLLMETVERYDETNLNHIHNQTSSHCNHKHLHKKTNNYNNKVGNTNEYTTKKKKKKS